MLTIRFNMGPLASAGTRNIRTICEDTYNVISKMIGTPTADLVPTDLGDMPESYRNSSSAITYVLRRVRNIPSGVIVKVGYEAPYTLTVSIKMIDLPWETLPSPRTRK